MSPESRGKQRQGQSESTPTLSTLRSLTAARNDDALSTATISMISSEELTSPSEPASIDDYPLDPATVSASSASSLHNQSEEDEEAHVGEEDEEEGEQEEEDTPIELPTRPAIYSHHFSRSQSYLGSSAFAPPFYNRPPTPLPPSPSLTSLLRPTFSSYNSRPTTPDVSSDEGGFTSTRPNTGTQTPNSAAVSTLTSSFRTAKPVPRASPKVPTYEYYGFTLYLTSSLAFLVYLLWAYLPSPFLHSLGIYYYPNRWWALAIPAWLVMFIVYIYVALAAYNTGHLTLPLDDIECLVDEAANIAVVDADGNIIRRKQRSSWRAASPPGKHRGGRQRVGHSLQSSTSRSHQQLHSDLDWRKLWNEGTDAVMDIPIGGVCEILYAK